MRLYYTKHLYQTNIPYASEKIAVGAFNAILHSLYPFIMEKKLRTTYCPQLF